MANNILDPIFKLYDPIRYSFNKKKEDYIIISPTVGSKSQLNDGGRITFEINSLSNWLLLSDAYFGCDFKIKDGTPNENRVPQTNTTLENNFFPSLFSEMVLEAGSNPIETIKHPGKFDTMLKTVLYRFRFSLRLDTRCWRWKCFKRTGVVCWSKNAQKEERLADPGSRGEDSDGVEGEDESDSGKRRGVPSLREPIPMSAGQGVDELRARLGVWFGSVVALDGAGVVSISVGRDMVTLVFVSLIVW
ncbi:hypothetical protein LOTGIDRAFT_155084 [Lottia gigantea]|uniref:Uncharacterized protein n=1 Tax=Lottia gigantea TaxID=225164 RepID=V3ZMQ7_LOTGI|nr:hypothetical protein LOTGIDRAFT_155084 [Lottia gigantea]ESO85597.1 hypothetical protein LOTGIDRAFT_155084 [Lottia gigantea]